MRYLAWPALVACLSMVITLIGLPAAVMDSGAQMENPSGQSVGPDGPTQHRPPSAANSSDKTSNIPEIESDHSGINEKARL